MKAPDMAFVSTACPEPQDQTAVDIHPATQALHDTGHGPLKEFGDEPVKREWPVWTLLALGLVPWAYFVTWFYLNVWPKQ